MRVLIVDDHEVVREGLRAVLGAQPRFTVVGVAATGSEALALAPRVRAHVAVVDLRLSDMPGDDVCRGFTEVAPEMRIIVLSSYLSEETVRRALNAGAVGYVTKAAGIAALINVLKELADDRLASPDAGSAPQIVRELHRAVSHRMGPVRATPQQERILELCAQGLKNREVGARLYISESTVRFHLQRLKDTLGAKTRTELIAKAIRLGIIPPADEAPK